MQFFIVFFFIIQTFECNFNVLSGSTKYTFHVRRPRGLSSASPSPFLLQIIGDTSESAEPMQQSLIIPSILKTISFRHRASSSLRFLSAQAADTTVLRVSTAARKQAKNFLMIFILSYAAARQSADFKVHLLCLHSIDRDILFPTTSPPIIPFYNLLR